MDGKVVIGIDANSSEFDKKLYKLEKELRKREVNIEVKSKDVKATTTEINTLKRELESVDKEIDNIAKDSQRLNELEFKGEKFGKLTDKEQFEYMTLSMSGVAEQESNLLAKRDELNSKIDKSNAKLTEQNSKLQEANELYQETKLKIDSLNHNQITQGIDNIKNSMEGVIKKVTKWGLAIFGIRSIYMGIRQAVSQIMQDDDNLKYQIDYMKWAIGQAIKPIVEWIVNLVHKILVGVGAIIKLLFGVNIFANATADGFKKANTSAKKLSKTLAGFDEMNVLNEDGTTGVASSIGEALKDWDLAKEVDKLTKKLKTLLKNFSLDKIKEHINNFINWCDTDFLGTLRNLFGPIGDAIYLPFEVAIKAIRTLFENLFGGVKKIIDGIIMIFKGNFAEGIKNIFGGLLDILSTPFRVMATIVETTVNRIIEFFKGMATWLYDNVIKPVGEWFSGLWNGVKEGASGTWNGIIQVFSGLGNWIYQNVITPVGNIFGGLWNSIKDGIIGVWNKMTEIFGGIVTWIYNHTIKPIVDFFSSLAEKLGYFFNWLDKNSSKYSSGGGGNIGGSGGGFRAKGGIYYPSKLPKLAVGGIINMPGRGVPYNGAIIGERGAEAVVPLTDSQQMELLGEAIGRYISVNLTNITELDGRQIARKVEQINQNDRFVLNR